MANRLYNKQVSPKGYKKGGTVSKGGGRDSGQRGEAKSKATIQNMRLERKFPLMATLAFKSGLTKNTTLPIKGKHKKRVKKMGGGSLKAVPAGNKGLKKLPTKVRNKMGFMKKGGKVNGK